jgi:putative FmdB family regulatory protein
MPLYEYECGACGHRFEAIQKFSDSPLEKCPKCGGALRKLQAAPAFHLKGSGWYATDYGKKDSGTKDSGTKDQDSGTKDSSSSSTKTDTPAATTDTSAKKTDTTTSSASPSTSSSTKNS